MRLSSGLAFTPRPCLTLPVLRRELAKLRRAASWSVPAKTLRPARLPAAIAEGAWWAEPCVGGALGAACRRPHLASGLRPSSAEPPSGDKYVNVPGVRRDLCGAVTAYTHTPTGCHRSAPRAQVCKAAWLKGELRRREGKEVPPGTGPGPAFESGEGFTPEVTANDSSCCPVLPSTQTYAEGLATRPVSFHPHSKPLVL